MAATVTHSTANSGYEFLQCNKSVGSKGETYVVLQWGKTKGHYSFHAYPESSKRGGKKYRSVQVN